MNHIAVVIGATGLVGGHLINEMLGAGAYQKIYAITRRKMVVHDDRLINIVMDFSHLEDFRESLTNADAYCCLGTTIKTAGSRAAFRTVDFTYPLQFAKLCRQLQCENFSLVSAVGADAHSPFFYSQVKGELETAVSALGFKRLTIVRPSLLLGKRQEKRLFESLAAYFSPCMIGPLRPYQGIFAQTVARALLALGQQPRDDQVKIVSSLEMKQMG